MAKKVSTKKAQETVETPVIQRPDADVAIEKRLIALYTLQSVDSEIDRYASSVANCLRPYRTWRMKLPV